MIIHLLMWALLLIVAPVHAAPGVAVVQSVAPTSNGGTQDFTSSGFGTPVCAMFFVSYGTANGTVVDHAMWSVGFSDFTNHRYVVFQDEDAQTTTDTGGGSGSGALATMLNTDQSIDGTATAATITDGVRLTWADAPPVAYLVTAVMFNASLVSNCVVGQLTASTSIGGTASVSGLGWQPQVVLAATDNDFAGGRTSFGIAIDDSGIVQYAIALNSQSGASTSDVTQVIRNDRLTINPAGTGGSSQDLTSWDSGGFTVTTRDATAAKTIYYLAMRLQTAIAAKLIACNSPTSTGNASCTGTGWTPQAGIYMQTVTTTINTYTTSGGDNESHGLSAFTASQSSTMSVSTDDGVTTSNTTSMTDNKLVRLYKDGADYIVGTLTGFQSNGVDRNYTTTDGTARLGAMLLFKADATAVRPRGSVHIR